MSEKTKFPYISSNALPFPNLKLHNHSVARNRLRPSWPFDAISFDECKSTGQEAPKYRAHELNQKSRDTIMKTEFCVKK
ncbi:hypothetical protein ACTXT7_005141 [Hymenolepis weldensis]